jgi:ADP-ribose pyrophosphatase YjhB (NUDIX family)
VLLGELAIANQVLAALLQNIADVRAGKAEPCTAVQVASVNRSMVEAGTVLHSRIVNSLPKGFDQHGSPEQAAVSEVAEELGLTVPISALRPTSIQAQFIGNPCRRIGGDYHVWWVFEVTGIEAELNPSPDETLGAGWYDQDELERLAQRTKNYQAGMVPQKKWEAEPGLEVVWLDLFAQLSHLRHA